MNLSDWQEFFVNLNFVVKYFIVLLSHRYPQSLLTMLKCAGRFLYTAMKVNYPDCKTAINLLIQI